MEGIDAPAVTRWLARNLGLRPPLSFELFPGGRSNLTYCVTDDAGCEVVLRRPPVGHVLPTAHDMAREHRVVSALAPTAVPVPEALASCVDEAVTGAPFYVMARAPGHVARDARAAEEFLDPPARRRASEAAIEVLAALHGLDPAAVGLGDLGRREGYVARQLERWHGQFDRMQVEGGTRASAVDEVYEQLRAAVPAQRSATIVHGDYRLDNLVLATSGDVSAVLDWEMCTLGDPLADLGLLLVYWSEPGDAFTALDSAPTSLPGFASRAELRARYESETGRDLGEVGFYVAFGYFKLACILQGVWFRYRHGAGGGDRSGVDMFEGHVRRLAGAAKALLAEV